VTEYLYVEASVGGTASGKLTEAAEHCKECMIEMVSRKARRKTQRDSIYEGLTW
jgi:hypothetical protein